MILNRLGTAIRRQDWFVVFIEIFTVVFGVFIGLQVDDWNQARKDRALEIRYLERIDANLAEDFQSLSWSIDSAERRIERAYFLLAAAENEALIYNDPTYFIESIEYAGYTFMPTYADHTFEEIKASGRLLIIRNEKLRSALAAHYNALKTRGQFDFIRQEYQLKYLDYQFGILSGDQQIAMALRDRPEYGAEEAREVYARMMAKPEFLEWMARAIQSKLRTAEVLREYRENVAALRALIAEELGREVSE